MELIHADSNFNEIGYVDCFIKYDACVELAHDGENNWQLDIDSDDWLSSPIEVGHYLYIEGTEWGGPVEKIKHITSSNTVQLSGPLWRGMLARQVIFPTSGSAYKTISETEANTGISELLNGSLGVLFTVSTTDTAVSVSGKFRYPLLLEAINKMLDDSSMRLEIELDVNEAYASIPCRVILSAKAVSDWSETIEFSQDYDANITSTLSIPEYNHVVALGQGELTERTVIELWLLADGSITSDTTADIPTGMDCRSFIYDYSSVESAEELTKSATEKLKEYAAQSGIEIDLSGADVDIPLGDYVGLRDRITGLSATQRVSKKILTISSSGVSIAHYVS